MSKIKVTIDGKETEVSADALSFPEGYSLITPNRVPDGYYTKDALESKIQDRVARAKKNAESDLLDDESFQRKVLSKKGITLDKNGKPKGLEPDFDPEEWKQQKAKDLTEPLKNEIEEYKSKINTLKRSKIQADILTASNGFFKEEYTKSLTGDDNPYVVDKFSGLFDVDPETGQTALKDKDGTFAVDGDGSRITPNKYFESNADKFSGLLQDKRQGGSGYQGGGDGGTRSFTKEQVESMSDAEYKENREAINKAIQEGRYE